MSSPEASQSSQWHYSNTLDDQNSALHGHHGTIVLLTVLCILLLITLLYLYLRWTCYNHSLTPAAAVATTVVGTPERASHAPSGLDEGIIKCLPVELHRAGENMECVICLGVFTTGEKVKVLPICSHGFHPECIDGWLRTQPNCPLCRASVVKKTVADDVKDMV